LRHYKNHIDLEDLQQSIFDGEKRERERPTPFIKSLLGASVTSPSPPELNPIFGPQC